MSRGEPALLPALLPAATTRGRPRPISRSYEGIFPIFPPHRSPAPPLTDPQALPGGLDTVSATHRGGAQTLSAHLTQSGNPGRMFTAAMCVKHKRYTVYLWDYL